LKHSSCFYIVIDVEKNPGLCEFLVRFGENFGTRLLKDRREEKMKKLLSLLLLVLILALAVAACAPAGEGTTEPGGLETPALETPSLGETEPAVGETPMPEATETY
jgi:hypothetical protein